MLAGGSEKEPTFISEPEQALGGMGLGDYRSAARATSSVSSSQSYGLARYALLSPDDEIGADSVGLAR